MLTAVGFGFLGAVVDEDGTVNHILSIFSVYPHRGPYPHSNAQGYAVRRHDDAVLRGAVGAEDDGARVVHNSTATKNTSLQSVRDIIVIAMPWNAPLKRSALNIDAGHVSNLPSTIISAMIRITRSGGLSVLILLPLHILLKQFLEAIP